MIVLVSQNYIKGPLLARGPIRRNWSNRFKTDRDNK